jgi:Fe-S cluster assembly protein SufD
VLVVAEDNVHATVVESYVGKADQAYFTNAVTEIVTGADCHIDHCRLQQESLKANHVSTMQVELGRTTTFVSHAVTTGGKLTRNDLNCLMNGEHAYATLNGLVLIGGDQHCDNHTLLHHEKPNCPSHELYKHVLSGKATGVFKGQIFVQKDAQKTDSKQNSKTLLLSDDAYMNSQPALEIYADDVKCTHGSTTGPVDEDMVFYLRTRGVSLEAARHLLTYAFAADVTRRIKVEPVRRRIENFMAAQHGLPQDLRITDVTSHDEAVL